MGDTREDQLLTGGDGALLFGRNFGEAAVAVSQCSWNLLWLTRVAAVHDGVGRRVSRTVEHRANVASWLSCCCCRRCGMRCWWNRNKRVSTIVTCVLQCVQLAAWYAKNVLPLLLPLCYSLKVACLPGDSSHCHSADNTQPPHHHHHW